VFKNVLKKQKEIQYIVKDTMLEKQNKIINKLIRISLDNTDIKKAAQKMIMLIEEQYSIKNCSFFIGNKDKLDYLGTDVPEEYLEDVKKYINRISTTKDAVFIDSAEGGCLSYSSAEKRHIVFSVFIYLKKMNDILGSLYLELDSKQNIEVFEQEIFKTVMETLTIALENLIIRQELIELSSKDQLTKLYNRTYLQEYIKTLEDKKYSLAMLDIDYFKKINDTYGHKTGDDVLKYVSSILNKITTRINGEVFRIGGEEFLVVAFESKPALSGLIEEVRKEIEHKELINNGKIIKLTISSGIADFYDGVDFEDVQNKADQELYKAKESGRNKICIYKTKN
jgi:diguanylate cyclase (GGDEF)-like protein